MTDLERVTAMISRTPEEMAEREAGIKAAEEYSPEAAELGRLRQLACQRVESEPDDEAAHTALDKAITAHAYAVFNAQHE